MEPAATTPDNSLLRVVGPQVTTWFFAEIYPEEKQSVNVVARLCRNPLIFKIARIGKDLLNCSRASYTKGNDN
jgi:hypothetical protein